MSTVSGGRRRAFRSRHHTPMAPGGKLAIIFVTVALLLFVFAVMLGNYLRGLAIDIIEDTTLPSSTEAEVYYANPPAEVISRGIVFGKDYSLETETETETEIGTAEESTTEDTTADDEKTDANIIEEDPVRFDSVSVRLRKRDRDSGEMLLAYSSEVSLEYSIDVRGSCDLYEGVELIKENWGDRTKICGIFDVDYLSRSEETRGIMRAYEIALICELIDAGFDEIMLIGFSGAPDEGLSFISDIYEQKGRGTVIGIAFSFDFLISEGAGEKIDEVAKKCGFLALDLSSAEVPSLMSAESLIADRVSRTLELCREYSIRVILGCGNAPDVESQTRTAIDSGANNIMTALGIEIE